MTIKRFLGIDPGTRLAGYALLDAKPDLSVPALAEAGVIRLPERKPLDARLVLLAEEFEDILQETQPDVLVMEDLFSQYKSPRTAIVMGHARGVMMMMAKKQGLDIHNVTPTTVKKALTGSGRAPKGQVQLAVQQQFGLAELPDPPDVADAIAIAACGAQRWALKNHI